jgi:hypothetical protein
MYQINRLRANFMETQKEESPEIVPLIEKLRKFFKTDAELFSLWATLLGAAANISDYILEKEKNDLVGLPNKCKYGLLHVHQVLSLVSCILRDKVSPDESIVPMYMPSGNDAWQTEEDFEDRLICLTKTFYEYFNSQGKI